MLLAVAGLVASAFIGPKRYNSAKLDRYESGLMPTPGAAGGGRIPIKYYLVAMTFIIFDIEVVFLYPWAVAYEQLGAVRPHRHHDLPRAHHDPLRVRVAPRRIRVGVRYA